MKKPHIAVAIPAYGGMAYMRNSKALIATFGAAHANGIEMSLLTIEHESLVQRARNTLVNEFLKNAEDPEDRLLFIDGDIQFDPQSVFALYQTGFPVVAGAYPKKRLDKDAIAEGFRKGSPDPWSEAADYFIMPELENWDVESDSKGNVVRKETIQVDNSCIPCHWVGTGFLMMSAGALLDMCRTYPETAYCSDSPGQRGEVLHALFDCEISHEDGGVYLSEDYMFCKRWRKMGGRVMLHLGINLDHIGTHIYQGNTGKMFTVKENA